MIPALSYQIARRLVSRLLFEFGGHKERLLRGQQRLCRALQCHNPPRSLACFGDSIQAGTQYIYVDRILFCEESFL
jgi:hypothetical protein